MVQKHFCQQLHFHNRQCCCHSLLRFQAIRFRIQQVCPTEICFKKPKEWLVNYGNNADKLLLEQLTKIARQTCVAVPMSSGTTDPGSTNTPSNSVLLNLRLSISSTGHWSTLVPVFVSNSTVLGIVC